MKDKNQKEGCRHIYFGPLSATLKKHLTLVQALQQENLLFLKSKCTVIGIVKYPYQM